MDSSAPFSATLIGEESDAVIALLGELDIDTAPDLLGVLSPFLDEGPPEVVLDFSGLTFIDSSGISVLIAAQQRLLAGGRRLRVSAPRPHATMVFEVAGLTEYFHLADGGGSSDRNH
jgi:anti-sigma B factor antagonist